MEDLISLKEFFEREIKFLRELSNERLKGLQETSDAHWKAHGETHAALNTSIELALKELERRLGELNNLRREVTEDRAVLVRKDTIDAKFESIQKDLNDFKTWKENIITRVPSIESRIEKHDAEVGDLKTWRTRTAGIAAGIGLGAGAAGGGIGYIISKMLGG